MSGVDQHDALKAEPFTYRQDKCGTLTVFHQGRLARVFRGREAEKLLKAVQSGDPLAAQLALAKATGNFKRGNER